MLYAPLSLVFAVHTVPRSASVAVTSAPLTGALLGSVTVPTMEAVTSCVQAAGTTPSETKRVTTSAKENSLPVLISEPPGRTMFKTHKLWLIECYIAGG